MENKIITYINKIVILLLFTFIILCNSEARETVHVFEIKEITLKTNSEFSNPYKEIDCWIELSGPEFQKKIYGFWNVGNEFVFRLVATKPGKWHWKSNSNISDNGLNNQTGSFNAINRSEGDLLKNPNFHGFIKPTKNGHALEYADGTPFFMLGDTWWAASTWRFPVKGIKPKVDYIPNEKISFEEALAFRKKQEYNTIAIIAAFPNWKVDSFPAQYINDDSIGVRQAWEKNGMKTSKDMHDELGNMPFEPWGKSKVIANFDKINPAYFKSLDKKIQYLDKQGFVTFLETVRRDHGPSWKKYFDWPESYSRYVQYIIARYGAYNIIFSGIHLDWINKNFSLPAKEFNNVLTYHYNKYGGLPYGQPHTILIDGSTFRNFGHGKDDAWITMHSVGNVPRNHGFYPMIEELFKLQPAYPAANLEPYYPGWDNVFHNTVAGERPVPNSDRDNYFGRTQMYGSVLSGALAGHIYGTGAYDGNSTGESYNKGDRPYIWDAMNYSSGAQLQFLGKFILSEGNLYQKCSPKSELLIPNKAKTAKEDGLDGWAFFLQSPEKELGFIYFENKCETPLITGLISNSNYQLQWFNPISGIWLQNNQELVSDSKGCITIVNFPKSDNNTNQDWCLKIKLTKNKLNN